MPLCLVIDCRVNNEFCITQRQVYFDTFLLAKESRMRLRKSSIISLVILPLLVMIIYGFFIEPRLPTRPDPAIKLFTVAQDVIVKDNKLSDKLKITYDGKELKSLYHTSFSLRNTGNTDFTKTDLNNEAIAIIFSSEIIQSNIEDDSVARLGAKITPAAEMRSVAIEFHTFNKGNQIRFSILSTDNQLKVEVIPSMKGVSFIEVVPLSEESIQTLSIKNKLNNVALSALVYGMFVFLCCFIIEYYLLFRLKKSIIACQGVCPDDLSKIDLTKLMEKYLPRFFVVTDRVRFLDKLSVLVTDFYDNIGCQGVLKKLEQFIASRMKDMLFLIVLIAGLMSVAFLPYLLF
jgi:hypothetical protein